MCIHLLVVRPCGEFKLDRVEELGKERGPQECSLVLGIEQENLLSWKLLLLRFEGEQRMVRRDRSGWLEGTEMLPQASKVPRWEHGVAESLERGRTRPREDCARVANFFCCCKL